MTESRYLPQAMSIPLKVELTPNFADSRTASAVSAAHAEPSSHAVRGATAHAPSIKGDCAELRPRAGQSHNAGTAPE